MLSNGPPFGENWCSVAVSGDRMSRIVFTTIILCISTVLGAVFAGEFSSVPVSEEPRHHLVFENQFVHVLDVVVSPGDVSLFHEHSHDLVGVTIVGSLGGWTEVLGGAKTIDPPDKDDEVFYGEFAKSPVIHRVANTGGRAFHYVVAELLSPEPTFKDALPEMMGYKTELENPRVRVSRIFLEPGESSNVHEHRTGYVVISESNGRLTSTLNGVASTVDTTPRFLYWGDPGIRHLLKNTGNTRLEIDEIEVK